MHFLDKEILCTLGPSSRSERVISRLEALGVNLFRINLSHTSVEDLPEIITDIQQKTSIPICLDTEGAQIRTGKLVNNSITVKENSYFHIVSNILVGDDSKMNLYPACVIDELKVGDLITIDFNSVLVQIIGRDSIGLKARVITGGVIGSNKAVSADRRISLPALTDKDVKAVKIGVEMGITNFALSFANRVEDVELLLDIVGDDCFIISKIETLLGIQNQRDISTRCNALLLDRGDLSRELPIEQIPRAQKMIIERAKESGVKCYVATNLLESMCSQPNPTRAEVNDIFNTLNDGADGLVLAAETAIGDYPVECAIMIKKIINEFTFFSNDAPLSLEKTTIKNPYQLVRPHGGKLVERIINNSKQSNLKSLHRLNVKMSDLMNLEQIAIGTYSPLEGFQSKEEVESILNNYALPDGTVWTLPVMLQVELADINNISVGDTIALSKEGDQTIYGTLELSEIYSYDLKNLAKRIFSTDSETHPGVKLLCNNGSYFLAGKIELAERLPSIHKYQELTPRQTRSIFENKSWTRIVGFHTRNVAHRAHEYLQNQSLEKLHCDAVFIHPLVGPKKKGDYESDIILKSYELIIKKYFKDDTALVAAFQSYPRYSGPREAVFTAICRKNFGCSHFIVGRDHSGVGSFYGPTASQELFKELSDLDIIPIFFDEISYCKKCERLTDKCEHDRAEKDSISGTDGRGMIEKQIIPPDWYMRTEISEYLISEINRAGSVFVE
ncbi:MAG: sulfate adenylyltransferase [Bdellovibrionales bacterium]|jgi:pyruvate kinase|nr:sulfate adenylyltransferase [Bdellovibrionales bacterium]MBT3525217.1 sulfate adenylyltransferase [Bdellovibrionales bacterium]MBT7668257.1 sulfate adenylyltransferase [Bdellovibrionales bacterium]